MNFTSLRTLKTVRFKKNFADFALKFLITIETEFQIINFQQYLNFV